MQPNWYIVSRDQKVGRTDTEKTIIKEEVMKLLAQVTEPVTTEQIYDFWNNRYVTISDINKALWSLNGSKKIFKYQTTPITWSPWDIYHKLKATGQIPGRMTTPPSQSSSSLSRNDTIRNQVHDLLKTATKPASVDDFVNFWANTQFKPSREEVAKTLEDLTFVGHAIKSDEGYMPNSDHETREQLISKIKTKLDTMSYAELLSLNL